MRDGFCPVDNEIRSIVHLSSLNLEYPKFPRIWIAVEFEELLQHVQP